MNNHTLLFLYGTLRHEPLLTLVAGKTCSIQPATLKNHDVRTVPNADFPVIVADKSSQIDGLLLAADDDVRARLDFYEGGFGYLLETRQVQTADGIKDALVYFPQPGVVTPTQTKWSLDLWAENHAALALKAAQDAMANIGLISAQELAQMFARYRARGWSRTLSQTPLPTTLRTAKGRDAVTEFTRSRRHAGFFALDTVALTHRTFAGGTSEEINREVFIGTDAALVLPYDPKTDQVLLIEQFRAGVYLRDDPHPWVLEPVAGMVDAGEDPAETARREAVEEAGVTIDKLIPISSGYASPGVTTECYHCFLGLCDLSQAGGTGGLAEEHEDILSHVISRRQAMELIRTGEVNVLPLAAMLFWLEANWQGLRSHS